MIGPSPDGSCSSSERRPSPGQASYCNVADLPGQTLISPESLYPTIATVALLVLLLVSARAAATWALLAWSALHLIGGGILSVLPIGIFPFDPEQSVRHCAFHGLYAATQVPLVCVGIASLRSRRCGAR